MSYDRPDITDAVSCRRVIETLEGMHQTLEVMKREHQDFQTMLGIAEVEQPLVSMLQRMRRSLRRCYPATSKGVAGGGA